MRTLTIDRSVELRLPEQSEKRPDDAPPTVRSLPDGTRILTTRHGAVRLPPRPKDCQP